MRKYRSELKYIISNSDFNILKSRLDLILTKDKNIKNDSYKITSIYFDNIYKTSYYQVVDGINERWKYRIRFYNNSDNFIVLEKKYKINAMTKKMSVKLTIEEYNQIINGSIKTSSQNDRLLNEFIVKMYTELLRPLILIEYERIPYVHQVGNLRITLDYNIGYTYDFTDVFNKNKKLIYLQNKVLEVKYNELIPKYILPLLNLNCLMYTSFSKFKNCVEGNI